MLAGCAKLAAQPDEGEKVQAARRFPSYSFTISPLGCWVKSSSCVRHSGYRATSSASQEVRFLLVRRVPCDTVNAPIGQHLTMVVIHIRFPLKFEIDMKFVYVAIGALIALFPMASFVLVAVEVVMVYKIAKSHDAFQLGDLVWFCSKMVIISLFLKFLASWLHLVPGLGQIANSLVAGGFIYFAYDIADSHYASISRR